VGKSVHKSRDISCDSYHLLQYSSHRSDASILDAAYTLFYILSHNLDLIHLACLLRITGSPKHNTCLVAGVNTARHEACRKMISLGFHTEFQGVVMDNPNDFAYNKPHIYLIDDRK